MPRKPDARCLVCHDALTNIEHWVCTDCKATLKGERWAEPAEPDLPVETNYPVQHRLVCLGCGLDRWLTIRPSLAHLYNQAGLPPCPQCRGLVELTEDAGVIHSPRLSHGYRPDQPKVSSWI